MLRHISHKKQCISLLNLILKKFKFDSIFRSTRFGIILSAPKVSTSFPMLIFLNELRNLTIDFFILFLSPI